MSETRDRIIPYRYDQETLQLTDEMPTNKVDGDIKGLAPQVRDHAAAALRQARAADFVWDFADHWEDRARGVQSVNKLNATLKRLSARGADAADLAKAIHNEYAPKDRMGPWPKQDWNVKPLSDYADRQSEMSRSRARQRNRVTDRPAAKAASELGWAADSRRELAKGGTWEPDYSGRSEESHYFEPHSREDISRLTSNAKEAISTAKEIRVTAWRAEIAAKQARYEQKRAIWAGTNETSS